MSKVAGVAGEASALASSPAISDYCLDRDLFPGSVRSSCLGLRISSRDGQAEARPNAGAVILRLTGIPGNTCTEFSCAGPWKVREEPGLNP
jgi:hypothetical protein